MPTRIKARQRLQPHPVLAVPVARERAKQVRQIPHRVHHRALRQALQPVHQLALRLAQPVVVALALATSQALSHPVLASQTLIRP